MTDNEQCKLWTLRIMIVGIVCLMIMFIGIGKPFISILILLLTCWSILIRIIISMYNPIKNKLKLCYIIGGPIYWIYLLLNIVILQIANPIEWLRVRFTNTLIKIDKILTKFFKETT